MGKLAIPVAGQMIEKDLDFQPVEITLTLGEDGKINLRSNQQCDAMLGCHMLLTGLNAMFQIAFNNYSSSQLQQAMEAAQGNENVRKALENLPKGITA